jgi:hypothetical protein
MKELRIGMTEMDLAPLTKMLDTNNNGTIAYPEFVKLILGDMTPNRLSLVDAAYKELSKAGSVTIDVIKNAFCPEKHPDVRARQKTEGEVLSEFIDTFDQNHGLLVRTI